MNIKLDWKHQWEVVILSLIVFIYCITSCITHSVALGSIKKNISFFNLYLLYFSCSKLKQMFRSWFNFAVFFLPKLIINRIFLNTFQIGNLITDWDNWNIFIIRFEQLRERSSSLITVNTSESFKSLWSQYITSCFFLSTER